MTFEVPMDALAMNLEPLHRDVLDMKVVVSRLTDLEGGE